MRHSLHYKRNLEKFARDNLVEAYRLEWADCSHLRFCKTYKGELNLIDKRGEHSIYLHAQEGAELEARYWAGNLALESTDVLFVFGLGLGYCYLPLKEWLQGDPKKHLVFLEDDPSIIRCFLHTPLAEELMDNPQVIIRQIPKLDFSKDSWENFRESTLDIAESFFMMRSQLSALQSYFIFRFDVFNKLFVMWPIYLLEAVRNAELLLMSPNPKYHNFYANVPFISEAALACKLHEGLKGIPAVLCGAGPSLVKQLPALSKLSDKALIIASGSGINAISQAAITPHMAGGIDQTEAQASRLLTSLAFEVPIIYQNSFYDKALEQWHGPLVYAGTGGMRIAHWFEEMLGIAYGPSIISGESTSNFLCEVASFLQCNPIVMVGMDLAYTQDSRYAKGVEAHPADDASQHRALEYKERTIPVKGVDGKEVYTTVHWCYEAGHFASIRDQNPNIEFLNATEGGMPIQSIENVTFSEAISEYFLDSWDIYGWMHGVIQNASRDKISEGKALDVLKQWKSSLERCSQYLDKLMAELRTRPYGQYSGRTALWQVELEGEVGYLHFLKYLDLVYDAMIALKKRAWRSAGKAKRDKEAVLMEIERCRFLKGYVSQHLLDIEAGMSAHDKRRRFLEKKEKNANTVKVQSVPDYRKNGRLRIEENGVSIDAPYEPYLVPIPKSKVLAVAGVFKGMFEGQMLCFYSSGKVKVEAIYHQGKLHGPWTFYGENGMMLYRSWYVEGKRQGTSAAMYNDGSLYNLRSYVDDLFEGEHLYYYPDGMLKTHACYRKGKLNGVLRLYYSNGKLKKEQHFVNGVLDGRERHWALSGKMTIDAAYKNGLPVGISRRWDENGVLIREVSHENRKK